MLNPVFSRTSRQEGSSLIEVLVAIIVLSVGMLSMLWAQTKSMGFERTAEFRNIAAQIASEYADRIRANLNVDKGVARGDRANAYLYTAGYDPTANIPPYSGPDCLKGTVICTHYDMTTPKGNIKRLERLPTGAGAVARCQAVYEEMPGWKENTRGARRWEDLPENARRYVERLAELSGAPIDIISTGPDREETIVLRHPGRKEG